MADEAVAAVEKVVQHGADRDDVVDYAPMDKKPSVDAKENKA